MLSSTAPDTPTATAAEYSYSIQPQGQQLSSANGMPIDAAAPGLSRAPIAASSTRKVLSKLNKAEAHNQVQDKYCAQQRQKGMRPPTVPAEWELPKLRYSLTFGDDGKYADQVGPDTEFFDVKFYPYSPPGSNPVFAAVSKRHIFICRLTQTKDANPCEIIRVIQDDDVRLYCICYRYAIYKKLTARMTL